MIFDKPRSTTIDLDKLKVDDIEYYCTTRHIDERVCAGRKMAFNVELAKTMEEHTRFYFVVKTNREHDCISGERFEPWLIKSGMIDNVEQAIEFKKPSAKADACMQSFADALVQQFKKNEAKQAKTKSLLQQAASKKVKLKKG